GVDGPRREKALRSWARWAAKRDAQYHLGTTAQQVVAAVYRVYHAAGHHPLQVGPYRVDDTVIPGLLLDPLSDDSPSSQAELASFVVSLTSAARGKPAHPDAELLSDVADQLTGSGSALHSAQTAIMCADAPVPHKPRTYWREIRAHRASAPLFSPVDQTI